MQHYHALGRGNFYAEKQHINKVLPFGAKGAGNYASLILISWFLIILVLLDVALLFICLMHCKHLRLSDVNKHTYLLTYLLTYRVDADY